MRPVTKTRPESEMSNASTIFQPQLGPLCRVSGNEISPRLEAVTSKFSRRRVVGQGLLDLWKVRLYVSVYKASLDSSKEITGMLYSQMTRRQSWDFASFETANGVEWDGEMVLQDKMEVRNIHKQ